MPGIIVGVDGSEHSLSALDWALNEADLRKTPLTVITVSPIVTGIYGPGYAPADYYPAEEESRAQAEKATQELVNQAVGRRGAPPDAPVTVRALSGTAADELINASAGRGPARGRSPRGGRFRPAGDGLGQHPGDSPRAVPGGGRAGAAGRNERRVRAGPGRRHWLG